jgi:hypothetical protein
MAELTKSCDVSQAYNFQKDAQVCIGHINKLKIGDKQFDVDQKVKNPVDQSDVKVMGVLSGITWNGGKAEPVSFSAQVSTANKTNLKALVHGTLSKTDVEMVFTVYDYDLKAKVYYKSFHCNDEALKGLINKQGGALQIQVADNQSQEVVSPANYTLSLSVMPQDLAQALHLGFANDMKAAAEWGVTVAV